MRHAVILAGGSGTRLWPASRRARPKQFLAFGPDGETLLEAAIRRGARVGPGAIVVVTGEALVEPTREVIGRLPGAIASRVELVGEPVGRNTAAAIALAAATLEVRDPDAALVVLPADQRVADEAGFQRVVETGLAEVERAGAIGTIGIVPTRAETGFGYLEVASTAVGQVTPVRRFVEKPDAETAARYVASGTYLWNAGMFLASAKRVLAELEVHLGITAQAARAIVAGSIEAAVVYPTLPAISFDYAVMERTSHVFTIPAAIGWDDIGSWAAVAQLAHGDAVTHNATRNASAASDADPAHPLPIVARGRGNYVESDDGTLIVALGVEDLVIVKRGDAILVARKAASQDVREVIAAIEQRGLDRYL